jgi:hypothetical protein
MSRAASSYVCPVDCAAEPFVVDVVEGEVPQRGDLGLDAA